MEHLRKFFQVLWENQLYVKREKCDSTKHELHFQGHVINQGKQWMNDEKIRVIQEWEAPSKVTDYDSSLDL